MARNRTAVFLTKNPIFYSRDYNESFGSTAQAIIFVQDSEGNFTIPLNLQEEKPEIPPVLPHKTLILTIEW